MSNEFSRQPEWHSVGQCQVSSEVFLDVIFTSACDCRCPFCISCTKEYAREDEQAWRNALKDAFRLFDIRNVILLGGEATVDPRFREKLQMVSSAMERHPVDHLILTTNGNKLRDPAFLDLLLESRIDAVNLSRMHYEQEQNNRIFSHRTLTPDEIACVYERLKAAGKTLRLNVNVWKGNLNSVEEMEAFVKVFAGKCDAIKFTPLMETSMFDTEDRITRYTKENSIPETGIAMLWDAFLARHKQVRRASRVLGYVDYAEADVQGQQVILKYAQVEDKYDREKMIPTLKLYPNGCLSNEWSFTRDIRERLTPEELILPQTPGFF